MPAPPPYRPFASTAAYYHFRAPYAPAAIAFLVETFALDAAVRVLDLGCGPGTLTVPLAAAAGEVVAVDPEPHMLDEARRVARAAACGNIRWLCARAEDLDADIGPVRLATLGQSFHWMDRDAVLARLSRIIEPRGGLALVNPGCRRPQESWEEIAYAVVARFLGPRQPAAGRHAEPEHEPALRRSSHFSRFEPHVFEMEFVRDVASVIGAVYSLSYAARPRFGDEAVVFETALTEALLTQNPSGRFQERVQTEVIVARRADD
ncbi:MAG TPA: class I SAM-dependent methyltransferase [Phenylobacterium sp.]|jgi:SAM-dependent methyltransferase|nr:class I SAM-dependent methyltransferase [Phenylobacterium sp.]